MVNPLLTKEMAAAMGAMVKQFVGEQVALETKELRTQVETLQQQIKDIPVPKDGAPGADGKSITPGEVKEIVIEQMIAPLEKVGERLTETVNDLFKSIPAPKDGAPGRDGIDGVDGAPGADGMAGQDGVAGKDGADGINGENGKDGIDGKDGTPGADGKDGEPGAAGIDGKDGADGAPGMAGADGKDGVDGKDGTDGENGKDGVAIAILPDIDENKSYTRGSYATHKGGLWHAHAKTKGMRGWECIVDGLAQVDVLTYGNDERTVGISVTRSGGDVALQQMKLPVMIYRDVYNGDNQYAKDDAVTYAGCLWVAREDTAEVPGTSKTWRLAVKKGRDANPVVKASA